MTNTQQSFVDARPVPSHLGLDPYPYLGGPTMFPSYDRLALDLEYERRREAERDHLARLAVAASDRHSPAARGHLRDLRLAAGAALVHAGEAILPREDRRPGRSHPTA